MPDSQQKSLINYVRQKKDKNDNKCNICCRDDTLSFDHVPPQSTGNTSRVAITNVLGKLSPNTSTMPFISQNGVKFKTICRGCNSKLGRDYDPAFTQFINDVAMLLKTSLIIPDTVSITTKPYPIAKALIGHLLAAKILFEEVAFDVTARNFFCNDVIPPDIFIYYWLYPYDGVAVLRDFAIPHIRGRLNSEIVLCQLLKFFPIAFLITNKLGYDKLDELQFKNLGPNDDALITINNRRIEGYLWPEAPEDGERANFLFGGTGLAQSVFANPNIKARVLRNIPHS